jgi:transposase
MSKQRKTYTREFKLEALRLAATSGRPITQIERELGLSQGTIAHWRREVQRTGDEAFPGHGHLLPSEARLRQLERENAILRQERDILKKAIAVVSPKPQ